MGAAVGDALAADRSGNCLSPQIEILKSAARQENSMWLKMLRLTMALFGAVVATALPCLTLAQTGPYPNRPVRLVAAAGPGGNPDVLGRLLASKFADTLGKPFLVENMPGGGGAVATNVVSKASPDGHTLLIVDTGALAIIPALQSGLPYDPLKDLVAITALARGRQHSWCRRVCQRRQRPNSSRWRKKEPGKLRYGSAGPGSIHHITMAEFASQTAIELQHIPYRGGTAMVNALLAAEVHGGWSGIANVRGQVEAGLLRALCVSTAVRVATLPTVPTCDEAGVKGFDIATMMGMLAPTDTPPSIVATLQAETAKALRDSQTAERLVQLGIVMAENGTAHYQQWMRDEVDRYGKIVKKLNLQAN